MKRLLFVCVILLQLGFLFAQDFPSTAYKLRLQFPGQSDLDFILDHSGSKLLGLEMPNMYDPEKPMRFKGDGKIIVHSGTTDFIYSLNQKGVPGTSWVGILMENEGQMFLTYLIMVDGSAQILVPVGNGKVQVLKGFWTLIVPGDISLPNFDPGLDGVFSNGGPMTLEISNMRFRMVLGGVVYGSGQITRSGNKLTLSDGRDTGLWYIVTDGNLQTDTYGLAGTWRKQ